MLQSFRKVFKSKLGLSLTLVFLVIVGFAFASSDVASTGMFGGISGGDRVAVVGNKRIDTSDLSNAMTNALDTARQTNPTITMEAMVAQGGIDSVLGQMIQRTALAEYARRHGMRAGKRLVDSEIAQIPAFRGLDGQFDRNAFLSLLAQRGLSEAAVRRDIETGLLARQLLAPIAFAPVMPESIGKRYASLLRERRAGAIATLPSAVYAPQGQPTDAQLQAFYKDARDRFIRPERRVIRYAAFGPEALGDLPAPTEAQIAERYNRDKAQYAATERRRFTQLVVPTQDAANAILAEVRGGKSLDVAAREKGLATAAIGPVSQADFANDTSAAIAQAAFTASQGAFTQPSRSPLGWYLIHVDAIDRQPARSLDQVRAEISAALAEEQHRTALADLSARLEDEFDNGSSLSDVAHELKLEVASTRPATADGRIYGSENETVPAILLRALQPAFEMREGEPQLAEIVPGESFLLFDIADITSSAVAPLAEIRDDVIAAWRQSEGSKAARNAADRIIERLKKGSTLAEAVAAEKRPGVPAPQSVDLNREQLASQGQVPSNLALFFSMAQGTEKKLEAPDEAGWYVVRLDTVEPGKVDAGDTLIASTLRQLGLVAGDEYSAQFVAAAQREVGVKRNENAISAVAAQLTGQAN